MISAATNEYKSSICIELEPGRGADGKLALGRSHARPDKDRKPSRYPIEYFASLPAGRRSSGHRVKRSHV